MSSPRDAFGSGSATGGFLYERGKLEDGENGPYRFLPPMHSLRGLPTGWACFHAQHFGYAGTSRKDKTKTTMQPFECVEDKDRSGLILVSCPECRLIEAKAKEADDKFQVHASQLKASGILDDKEIKKRLEPVMKPHREWFDKHNLSKKHFTWAMRENGTFVLLPLNGKAKAALAEQVDALSKKKKINAFDLDTGAWFTIKKSGPWNNLAFTVTVGTEPVPGVEGAEKVKLAPLSEDQIARAVKLPDLTTVTTILTKEQIQLLVESDGAPETVDTIMKMNQARAPAGESPESGWRGGRPSANDTAAAVEAAERAAAEMKANMPPLPQAGAQPQQPQQPPPAPTPTPPVEDEVAKLQRQLASALAKKAAAPAPTPAQSPTAYLRQDADDGLDPTMSPEEFAKAFPPPTR